MAAAAAGPLPLRLCQYVHMHVYLAAASPHAVSSWTASSGALLSQAFNPFGPFVAPRSLQPAWELPCRPARVCSHPAMAKKGSRSKSNARSPPRDPTSGHLGRACRKHDTMFRARPRSDCIQTCVAAFPLVSEARSKMHRLNIGSSRPRAKQGRRGGAARSGPSDHDASCRAATSQNLAPETRRYDAPRRVGVAGSKDALPPAVPWLLPLLRIAGTHVGCWVHHRPMATHTHARWCYTHAHTHTHPGSIVSCAMYPRVIALRAWRWCHRLISPVTPKRRISVHCNGPGRPSARSSLREAAARQRHARGKTCKGREKYDNTPGRRQSEGLQRHGGAGARLRGRGRARCGRDAATWRIAVATGHHRPPVHVRSMLLRRRAVGHEHACNCIAIPFPRGLCLGSCGCGSLAGRPLL